MEGKKKEYPHCNDPKGECFARTIKCNCKILQETYRPGEECPFKKPEQLVTSGRFYPYNKRYLT